MLVLLSAPSHPSGTVAFRRGFRCRSQLRGQWRYCTALPAHLWRIVVIKDEIAKNAEHSLLSLAVRKTSNFPRKQQRTALQIAGTI